jgi:crotonobetainyl-CoA:carnitine CoA-transferase CaiB-like acyl-CoA transferase
MIPDSDTRDRAVNAVERRKIIAAELENWTAKEILARLLANDVPSAPVLSRFELLNDPQVRENQILEEHENSHVGRIRQPRPAARFDRTPSTIRKLAPTLGQDNEAILSEIGYSRDEVERLKQNRILYSQTLRKQS